MRKMGLLPRPAETGKITEDLYVIRDGHVSLYVYSKGGDTISVDAGMNPQNLRGEFAKVGADALTVTHLFLTHSDRDHVGGLGLFANARVYLSADEEQMIDGRRKRFLVMRNRLPEDRRHELLEDGATVKAGSIHVRAIKTPGHTPGSMSYLIDDAILCTGDTLVLKDGLIRPTIRPLNMDNGMLKESIRKLAKLEGIQVLCTAHSGYTLDWKKAITGWR